VTTSAAFLAAIALHNITYCATDVNWDVFGSRNALELVGARSTTICLLHPKEGTFNCPHRGDHITVVGDSHRITLTWPGLSMPIKMTNIKETSACN
jgi:hypothetical protein